MCTQHLAHTLISHFLQSMCSLFPSIANCHMQCHTRPLPTPHPPPPSLPYTITTTYPLRPPSSPTHLLTLSFTSSMPSRLKQRCNPWKRSPGFMLCCLKFRAGKKCRFSLVCWPSCSSKTVLFVAVVSLYVGFWLFFAVPTDPAFVKSKTSALPAIGRPLDVDYCLCCYKIKC